MTDSNKQIGETTLFNEHHVLKLYSNEHCPNSCLIKIILTEKKVRFNNIQINLNDKPKELFELDPQSTSPILKDKNIIISKFDTIFEYLEEKFPNPSLKPNFIYKDLSIKKLSHQITTDLLNLTKTAIFSKNEKELYAAKDELIKALLLLVPIFKKYPFFLNKKYTVMDSQLSIILYFLYQLDINLPLKAKPLIIYSKKLFDRPGFKKFLETQSCNMKPIKTNRYEIS